MKNFHYIVGKFNLAQESVVMTIRKQLIGEKAKANADYSLLAIIMVIMLPQRWAIYLGQKEKTYTT
ncbi:hypothetical protein wVul_0045 [Wolbachia endosymbiont of Armadillidium vulgare str. wVulC]|uniref:hypothetical protein n=1 Tax=Wolbachia endosymbiont of Armadillidium vulgare TaxID=77039 RepID=UPI00064A930F|nr:hypothetical protein [Wolbachia endosymbiont of Armadillidium vulgare]KLT22842.1 hypothetical protein wVul_0045 [Wolbachia endosymbiont of Armadillidium vulgare str. wVulC]OJH31682.1 hypothetical protein Wxf_01078 [Wolbachia endosymbiont of Armadillidium vulgare]OJH32091.1 hypothetical protein Wxf_01512 [Wolbachia endosymbiont of Armadillidium vulgare]OJH32648.1 hypothetical protein Wxf_02092 [Wolbachia endosymbiont of Armadillidium vulgare]OJH33270.1 hypothetical protein Wxf_02746 [Wolbach